MKSGWVFCSLVFTHLLLAGPPSGKPQWSFKVDVPKTMAEKQVTSSVKVKVQFEFGENSEDAVAADWANGDADSSWTDKPMVWRYPLKRFSIWINGEQQGIPYEALVGEGDIHWCQVWASPHEVKIEFDGGDAGLAYELALLFHESKRMPGKWILTQRIWKPDEFSDDAFDRTIYHNDIWDDPNL